jgi:hypothetical protein
MSARSNGNAIGDFMKSKTIDEVLDENKNIPDHMRDVAKGKQLT